MTTELYANFMDNGQEKATKFIISDEWAQVEEMLRGMGKEFTPGASRIMAHDMELDDVIKRLNEVTRW